MLKHMDFILHADEDNIIKLRFYPKHSSLHLFDEGLKKAGSERTFGDVYKIYYCWSILISENEILPNRNWAERGTEVRVFQCAPPCHTEP